MSAVERKLTDFLENVDKTFPGRKRQSRMLRMRQLTQRPRRLKSSQDAGNRCHQIFEEKNTGYQEWWGNEVEQSPGQSGNLFVYIAIFSQGRLFIHLFCLYKAAITRKVLKNEEAFTKSASHERLHRRAQNKQQSWCSLLGRASQLYKKCAWQSEKMME